MLFRSSDTLLHTILTDSELSELAESLHVYLLSPHSFYYFLNVIRLAYQSQEFEQNAQEVLKLLRGIRQQSGKLGEELQVLQRHMTNASSKMSDVQNNYLKLDMGIGQAEMLEGPKNKPALNPRSAIKEETMSLVS